MHSKGVGGEVQSQIGNGGELVSRSRRASVAVGIAAANGTTIVVVYAVAATGTTTTDIDVAAVDETAVPTGTTMALDVAAVQTRITPLSQPRWRTSLTHRTSPLERRLGRRRVTALAL